jgi:hypothetical protein
MDKLNTHESGKKIENKVSSPVSGLNENLFSD